MRKFCVYIIYSSSLKRFYTGTTDDFEKRLEEHNSKIRKHADTSRGIPWEKFLLINELNSKQAFQIEKHIKSMKSSTYIQNLLKYEAMIEKLKEKFPGSSR